MGHVDCIETLVERQAQIAKTNIEGYSALQYAVMHGHLDIVPMLLDYSTQDITECRDPHDGASLLHECAAQGHVDLCQYFLSSSFSRHRRSLLNALDFNHNSPLHYAVVNHQPEMVRELLTAGADCHVLNDSGQSPLHCAVVEQHPTIVTMCCEASDSLVDVEDGEGEAPLYISAKLGSESVCRVLLSFGAKCDQKNVLGNYPLHIAAASGFREVVNALLDYGADVNVKDFEGKTALGMARMNGHQDIVACFQARCVEEVEQVQKIMKKKTSDESSTKSKTQEEEREESSAGVKKSLDEWTLQRQSAVQVSQVGEWKDYYDRETCEVLYWHEGQNVHQLEPPVEYAAALGEEWQVEWKTSDNEEAPGGGFPVYVHKITGEISRDPPPLNTTLLQELIQGVHQRRRKKMKFEAAKGESVSQSEYKRFWSDFDAETKAHQREVTAVRRIVRNWKRHRAKAMLETKRHEDKAVRRLQRWLRRLAQAQARVRTLAQVQAAVLIQASVRGCLTRRQEIRRRPERVAFRHEWKSALLIQKHVRGNVGRRLFRQSQSQKFGPRTFFEWNAVRKKSPVILDRFSCWQKHKYVDRRVL